ncbi:hypothetical protein [Rubripirellula reticaptiva]|uniref:Uncharacterized protein n=1 Tax=Rubripirellula reticaptiva TaxID=2528013 RepID=A0A5C6EPZ4_9BACT|nr:hypothetical protein [Rubripirellula reticaptiva]TWU49449.1 hypothetical protein Poly59_40640 [Rubripirellula reticaptiva]
MSLLQSNGQTAKRKNAPDETVCVEEGEDVLVDLWVSEKGLSWSLSRLNSKDPHGRGYRTLRPIDVRAAVSGLELLSRVFSNTEKVDADIRTYCERLSGELATVLSRMGRMEVGKGSVKTSLLATA